MSKRKKLLFLQPSSHMVYWGWFKYLSKNYDFFLISAKGWGPKVDFLGKRHIQLERRNILPFINAQDLSFTYKDLNLNLKKVSPDIILSKIYFTPYSLKAYNYSKKNNCKFFVIEEQQDFPRFLFQRLIFKVFFYFYFYKFRKFKFISVTKNSFNFLRKFNFDVKYLPVSYWQKINLIQHKQDKIKLLFVGKLSDVKNVEIVIEAINYLIKNKLILIDQIEFNITGKGFNKVFYESLIKKFNLEKCVNFLGFVENSKLIEILKENNIFILPSKQEPIGLVILEAIWANLPILCSKFAGSSCFVKEGYNGYLFDPFDFVDLANKILLFRNQKLREKFSNNSYKHFKKFFDYNLNGEKLKNIIEN